VRAPDHMTAWLVAWERAPFSCLESLLGPSPYGVF
jgi:hypothetical protein